MSLYDIAWLVLLYWLFSIILYGRFSTLILSSHWIQLTIYALSWLLHVNLSEQGGTEPTSYTIRVLPVLTKDTGNIFHTMPWYQIWTGPPEYPPVDPAQPPWNPLPLRKPNGGFTPPLPCLTTHLLIMAECFTLLKLRHKEPPSVALWMTGWPVWKAKLEKWKPWIDYTHEEPSRMSGLNGRPPPPIGFYVRIYAHVSMTLMWPLWGAATFLIGASSAYTKCCPHPANHFPVVLSIIVDDLYNSPLLTHLLPHLTSSPEIISTSNVLSVTFLYPVEKWGSARNYTWTIS